MNNRKEQLIQLLNNAIDVCEPIHYNQLNEFFNAKNNGTELLELEKEENKLGLTYPTKATIGPHDSGLVFEVTKNVPLGMSTLTIIATITDMLCDDRLAFNIDNDGFIVGVSWYYENQNKS